MNAQDRDRAPATPHDWQQDFAFVGGRTLHTCGNCNSTFRSLPYREVCWQCKSPPPYSGESHG